MKAYIYSLFNHCLVDDMVEPLGASKGSLTFREFPDGESHLRIHDNLQGKSVVLLDSLNHPNPKILPMLFFAKLAKSLGAKKVGLVCPYMAYMRQDKVFHQGEGITAQYFSHLIDEHFDWLVTVDPHLHRIKQLSELYQIPAKVVHAAPQISQWIGANIKNPFIIGPDSESEQWISEMANQVGCHYVILRKTRLGDKQVKIELPDSINLQGCKPVFIDDIISSGTTMTEAIKVLRPLTNASPVCIAIHPIYAEHALSSITSLGAKLVSCNTINDPTNQIDLQSLLSEAIVPNL